MKLVSPVPLYLTDTSTKSQKISATHSPTQVLSIIIVERGYLFFISLIDSFWFLYVI